MYGFRRRFLKKYTPVKRELTPEDMFEFVSELFDAKVSDLETRGASSSGGFTKQAAMYAMRKFTTLSYTEVNSFLVEEVN